MEPTWLPTRSVLIVVASCVVLALLVVGFRNNQSSPEQGQQSGQEQEQAQAHCDQIVSEATSSLESAKVSQNDGDALAASYLVLAEETCFSSETVANARALIDIIKAKLNQPIRTFP